MSCSVKSACRGHGPEPSPLAGVLSTVVLPCRRHLSGCVRLSAAGSGRYAFAAACASHAAMYAHRSVVTCSSPGSAPIARPVPLVSLAPIWAVRPGDSGACCPSPRARCRGLQLHPRPVHDRPALLGQPLRPLGRVHAIHFGPLRHVRHRLEDAHIGVEDDTRLPARDHVRQAQRAQRVDRGAAPCGRLAVPARFTAAAAASTSRGCVPFSRALNAAAAAMSAASGRTAALRLRLRLLTPPRAPLLWRRRRRQDLSHRPQMLRRGQFPPGPALTLMSSPGFFPPRA